MVNSTMVEQVFKSLQREKAAYPEFDKWICKDWLFSFEQGADKTWYWRASSGIPEDHVAFDMANNPEKHQTSGFKTLRDAVKYVRLAIGEDLDKPSQIVPLTKSFKRGWRIPNSNARLMNRGEKGWEIQMGNGIVYLKDAHNRIGFDNRKQAIEYLLKTNAL